MEPTRKGQKKRGHGQGHFAKDGKLKENAGGQDRGGKDYLRQRAFSLRQARSDMHGRRADQEFGASWQEDCLNHPFGSVQSAGIRND